MIRSALVLLVAHLVIPRLRGRSAAERHLLWAVALLVAAALPLLGLVLPVWEPEWARRAADAWPTLIVVPSWIQARGPDVVVRATAVESGTWSLARYAAVLWTAGTIVFLARLASDAVRLVQLARGAAAANDRVCHDTCEEMSRMLRLDRVPSLLVSPRALVPITWGLRHPRVLLPAAAAGWPHERVRTVLAHELAHVARADWLVHVIAQVLCAIYWFHPLFWTAERALGREGEQAADDQAIGLGLEASQYAEQLMAIVRASRMPVSSGAPAVAMARTAHLERRIAALLRPQASRRTVTRAAALATASCAVAMALPLAAMTNGGTIDVDVRAADLPLTLGVSSGAASEPMLPAVRRVRAADLAATADPGVVLPEIAEYTTPPLYSEDARRRRIEGTVTIAVHVDERGRLTASRVVKGLGMGLDQNALVALRQWRFRGGTRNGVPEAMDAEVDIEFDLRSDAVNALIANDMATLVGPGVTPPRVVRTARMALPVSGVSGSVVLDVVLLQDGSPKIVRILHSLTPEADESAVRHFEQWRFTPAMKSGVAIKVRMNAEVRFHG